MGFGAYRLIPIAVREKRIKTRAVFWSADHPGCLTAPKFAGWEHDPISASAYLKISCNVYSCLHRHFDPSTQIKQLNLNTAQRQCFTPAVPLLQLGDCNTTNNAIMTIPLEPSAKCILKPRKDHLIISRSFTSRKKYARTEFHSKSRVWSSKQAAK